MRKSVIVALAGVVAATACAQLHNVGGALPSSRESFDNLDSSSTRIRHVVIVVQENRSFDNLFATFPGADGATEGLMKTSSGDVKIRLRTYNVSGNSPPEYQGSCRFALFEVSPVRL